MKYAGFCIRTAALVLACVLMTNNNAFAQAPSSDTLQSQTTPSAPTASAPGVSNPSLERKFFRNLLRDQRAIWTAGPKACLDMP